MRGIVLEIKGDRCTVMKQDGSFAEVQNRHYAVGQEIRLGTPGRTRYPAVAACLALVCSALLGAYLYFTPTSFIYLDINPSIRLDLNRFERVIGVVPLNDDAENLLSAATVSRKNAQACMNDIVAACQAQRYLNAENTDVEISVCTADKTLESDLESASALIGDGELAVSVFQLDAEENNSALKNRISARRLRAVNAYTEIFGGTLEENLQALRGFSSDEIYEAIKEYRRALHRESLSEAQPEASKAPAAGTETDAPVTAETQGEPQPSESTAKPPRPSRPTQETSAARDDRSPGIRRLTAKRLAAIRAYTERFGGTLEENAALLQGVTSDEIYRKIEAAAAGEAPQ